MSTKERLGLDLVATDKSGAAFASFTRNLKAAKAEQRLFGVTANQAFTAFGSGLRAAGAAMGVTFGVGALTAFAKSAINDLANIKDQAERAGIAISDMQSLTFAARQGGGDQGDIVTIFQKLNMQLEKARQGEGELGAILDANNIKITDSAGRAREAKDIFYDIVDLIHTAGNGIDRGAISQAVFGKSAQDMLPYLNEGADAIRRQEQAARDVGAVIDDEIINKAAVFDDQWTAAWDGFIAHAKATSVDFASDLERLYSFLTNPPQSGGMFGINMVRAVNGNTPAVQSNALPGQQSNPEGKGNFGGLPTVMPPVPPPRIKPIHAERDAVAELIERLEYEKSLIGKTNIEREVATNLRAAGTDATIEQKNHIEELTRAMAAQQEAQKMLDAQQRNFEQLVQNVGRVLESSFSEAFSSIIDGTSSVEDAFKNMAKSILSQLAQIAINNAFQALMGGITGSGSGGGGGFLGSLLGGLFGGGAKGFSGLYAKGGSIPSGHWGIAGENGLPEPVMGPATVLPNSAFQRGTANDNRRINTSIVVNISTPDIAGFRRSQGQVAALLSQTVARGQRNL